ncbi:hypothetical protein LTR22_023871 [Elasticomyces elasticus]|nr:hypothetical protein LTR22_023871 [Elasticomyces elasticus]KAK4907148.1 hypothetical protein LTR49_023795 [Elasticomyces elasticus]KAK5754290.1 hypothetical protein LTS12_015581 [Elasticomyces elasticus]
MLDMEDLNDQSWRREDDRGSFLVCTKPDLLDHEFINQAFSSDDMFWAKRLPADQLAKALSQSVTLALYEVSPGGPPATTDEPSSPRTESPTIEASRKEHLQQIGLARLVTDHVTFVYLSDVYVLPTKRGLGLFPFLIGCVKDLLKMHPALRRAMLLTGSDSLRDFYARTLGVWDVVEETQLTIMSRKAVEADE